MKKIILFGTILIFMGCSKQKLSDLDAPMNSQTQQETDSKTKRVYGINQDMDMLGNTGCKPGSSNCFYFCCVEGATLNDYMESIDVDEVDEFLTQENIDLLSNGDSEVRISMQDAQDGNLDVIYVDSETRVAFLYGNGVSETSYEFAQVIDKK